MNIIRHSLKSKGAYFREEVTTMHVNYSPEKPSLTPVEQDLWITMLQAGAHMRAMQQEIEMQKFHSVSGFRARSIVLIARGANALLAAQLVMDLYSHNCDCPMTIASHMPSWVGALDIVIILTDGEEDYALLPMLNFAQRRAGVTIISSAEEGVITQTYKDSRSVIIPTLLFQPSVMAAKLYSIWRHISVLLATLESMKHDPDKSSVSLSNLADMLDEYAARVSLSADVQMNPAYELAHQFVDRQITIVSSSLASSVVAQYAQKQLFLLAQKSVAAIDYTQWCQRHMYRLTPATSVLNDIFYDPYDSNEIGLPERSFLVMTEYAADILSHAQEYGDIRPIIGILPQSVKSETEAIDTICANIITVDAAILLSRLSLDTL